MVREVKLSSNDCHTSGLKSVDLHGAFDVSVWGGGSNELAPQARGWRALPCRLQIQHTDSYPACLRAEDE